MCALYVRSGSSGLYRVISSCDYLIIIIIIIHNFLSTDSDAVFALEEMCLLSLRAKGGGGMR